VIHETLQKGGDPGHAALGVVKGAIHCAKDLGLAPSDAASTAAQAALDAAQEKGQTEAEMVCSAIDGRCEGVMVKLHARRPKPDPSMTP